MTVSRDEIFRKVREVLVDALGVDEADVSGQATLMGDLGAESIDFLDIVFRLEKTFAIKIAREELFPAESLLTDNTLVVDGRLTAKGLALLKEKMPHIDLATFSKDPKVSKLPDLFTVDAVVNFMEQRLSKG